MCVLAEAGVQLKGKFLNADFQSKYTLTFMT